MCSCCITKKSTRTARRKNCLRPRMQLCGNSLTVWRTRRKKLIYSHGKIAIGNESRPVCARGSGIAGGAAGAVQQGHEPVREHLYFKTARGKRRRPETERQRAAGRRGGRERSENRA